MNKLQTINSQFDNKMQTYTLDEKMWKKLVDIVKNPVIVDDKSKIPQWKFCTVKGEKRCTENMGSTDILMLDYDSAGMTIKDFETQFRMYRYILHTSYSYDGTLQKFRVLLFLDRDYEIGRMFFKGSQRSYSPYHFLIDQFQGIDPASFVRSQFFKIPAKKAQDAPYYYSIHDGEKYSLFSIQNYKIAYDECMVKQEQYLYRLEKETERMRKKNNGDLSKAKEYIDKKLDNTPEGCRHNTLFCSACWWKKIGGTFQEFKEIIPSWADKQYRKQINHLREEWDRLK